MKNRMDHPLGCSRLIYFCWVGKHINIIMKPTNSPSQGQQPNPRKFRLVEQEEKRREGQAGCRPNRSGVDHVYTLGKIIQGKKDAGLTTHCSFLDVQKAYDTVWRNGLWGKLSEIGIRGKMWRMMKNINGMCEKCCDAGRGNIELC